MKPDPRCLTCNGTGYVAPAGTNDMRSCPVCRPRRVDVTGSVGKSQTRRTLQGMADAIIDAIQRAAYAGETKPHVFLYVRPGALPSVKVTVELHREEHATVVMEKKIQQHWSFDPCTPEKYR